MVAIAALGSAGGGNTADALLVAVAAVGNSVPKRAPAADTATVVANRNTGPTDCSMAVGGQSGQLLPRHRSAAMTRVRSDNLLSLRTSNIGLHRSYSFV